MWVKSSDIVWIDQSPEDRELHTSLREIFKVFSANMETMKGAFQLAEELALGWTNPKADPMRDLQEAHILYQYGGPMKGPNEFTIFNDEISPVDSDPVTVPLDDAGRPLLDATGGRMRRSGPVLCPTHRRDMVGGRCLKCR